MEKKNNGGLIAIIIVLVIALLGVCFYVAYDKGLIFNNKEEVEEKEGNDEETNALVETELTTSTTINELNNIIKMIDPGCILYRQNIYRKVVLTHDDKMKITFESLVDNFVDLTAEEKQAKAYSESIEVKKINVSEVKAQYKKLFGEEPTELGDYGHCPTYSYDSTNNVYYKVIGGCGGTCGYVPISYINSYTEDNDNIYVYVSVGEPMSYSGSDILFINCDVTGSSVCMSGNVRDYIDFDNIINESNYQDFSEYKYTFKKNEDGTFYYDKIERLK